VYELPRYMTAADAAQQLMTVVANRRASASSDFCNLFYFSVELCSISCSISRRYFCVQCNLFLCCISLRAFLQLIPRLSNDFTAA